jgi:hypothetical protein
MRTFAFHFVLPVGTPQRSGIGQEEEQGAAVILCNRERI